jgi:hypothetical protein
MRLLRKRGKCRLEATNYRLISLLSAFYKMASGVITRRLETLMEGVIGRQQKACSSKRNIGSVLINLLNMMQLSKQRRMANLILYIDFKKAFDSIDHAFINSSLKILNFGVTFRPPGLHANLEKTQVIPIGAITSIEPEDQLCKDLKLNWTKSFTLLGFEIYSELNHLNEDFEKIFLKV